LDWMAFGRWIGTNYPPALDKVIGAVYDV